MTRLAHRRLLAAPLTALLLAACSGGGDAPAAQEEVDPKEAYVEQAAQVCASAQEEFEALGGTPTTPQEYGPYVRDSVAIADRARGRLAELAPPEQDRAELESKVLTPLGELVEQGRAWSAQVTAAGTDQNALLGLLGTRPTSAGIDVEFLREYGLEGCADVVAELG